MMKTKMRRLAAAMLGIAAVIAGCTGMDDAQDGNAGNAGTGYGDDCLPGAVAMAKGMAPVGYRTPATIVPGDTVDDPANKPWRENVQGGTLNQIHRDTVAGIISRTNARWANPGCAEKPHTFPRSAEQALYFFNGPVGGADYNRAVALADAANEDSDCFTWRAIYVRNNDYGYLYPLAVFPTVNREEGMKNKGGVILSENPERFVDALSAMMVNGVNGVYFDESDSTWRTKPELDTTLLPAHNPNRGMGGTGRRVEFTASCPAVEGHTSILSDDRMWCDYSPSVSVLENPRVIPPLDTRGCPPDYTLSARGAVGW